MTSRRPDDHELDWAINEALREEEHHPARPIGADTRRLRTSSRYRPVRQRSRAASVVVTFVLFVAASGIVWYSMRGDDRRSRIDQALDELRIDPEELRAAVEEEREARVPIDPSIEDDSPQDENGWKRQLEILLTSHERALESGIKGKPHQRIDDSTSLLWSALNKEPEHWRDVREAIEQRAFTAREPDVRRRIAFIVVRDPSAAGRELAMKLVKADGASFGDDELVLMMQAGLKPGFEAAHRRLESAPAEADHFWLALRALLLGDEIGLDRVKREFAARDLSREEVDRKLGAALGLQTLEGNRAWADTFLLVQDEIAKAAFYDDLEKAVFYYVRLRYFGEASSGRKIDLAHMPVDIKRFASSLPEIPDMAALERAAAELGQRKR